MSSPSSPLATSTIDHLEAVDSALQAVDLNLELPLAGNARRLRHELVDQINDYLLPRLRRLDAPLLAVVGGSTGAGKSTITNSLVGAEVSRPGVLRPTTRSPVLVCHPDDLDWFRGGEILPGLPRLDGDVTGTVTGGAVLRLVTSTSLGRGVAVIDAPDIDSVEEANRELASQLLAAADLWLFTTTAVRYADAVPWDFLEQARRRGTALAVIINRIPAGAGGEIVEHFTAMSDEAGFDDLPVFPIEATSLRDGRLPVAAVEQIYGLLVLLSQDADERARVVARTLIGAINSIGPRAREVAAAAAEQQEAADELWNTISTTYGAALDRLDGDLTGGRLLQGEVVDRWQEMIGTAELMRVVQERISSIRNRVGAFFTGRSAATAEVQGEITSTLEQLLADHGDAATAATVTAWRNLPGGRDLIGDDQTLERLSEESRAALGAEIRAWQDDILELVATRGESKRTTARVAALGVNSVGVALMVALFSQTGGLTGGEVAIAGGTAGLSQALLTAIFGEQAVRDLAAQARRLLLERTAAIYDADAERYRSLVSAVASPPEALDVLNQAVGELRIAR